MRTCKKCHETKTLEDFPTYVNTTGQTGRRHTCKTCRTAYNYERKMVTTYGISKAEYDALYEKAEGKCMTCRSDEELVIDHCHTTGKVRGLLCHSCNVSLGHAKDNRGILYNMIEYLEESL
jgi:hypothetical protein